MLTLLTTTGGRPQAWAICEGLMARQDYPDPVRWIVVDDGPEAQPMTFARAGWSVVVVRPTPFWSPGQNTQARNLLAGLSIVDDERERVVVIEDDDWYAPGWLRRAARAMDAAPDAWVVGEGRAKYYNVPLRRGRQLHNAAHASLCSTAVQKGGIALLRRACAKSPRFIDLELWRKCPMNRRALHFGPNVVGIKGLPGRLGIGMGHSPDFQGQPDPDGGLLRAWVGGDAAAYLAIKP